MQLSSTILIHNLTYHIPNDKPLFTALTLVLRAEKIGLVGKNGIGKSTLLRLIVGELMPDSGSIETIGSIAYCPQKTTLDLTTTVADMLNVSEKLQALDRITQGSTAEKDFLLLNEEWLVHERITQQLATFGLTHIHLDRPLNTLSGGERTRLFLAKAFIANPDFIILDEPTNNLDSASRKLLYAAIEQWQRGLIVVSHDRTLLNLMQQIVELTSLGVNIYGGTYDHFVEQKTLIQAANAQQLLDAKKSVRKTHTAIQTRHESREQKQSYGRKQFLTGKVDRLTANSRRGRSEKTQQRHAKKNAALLKSTEEKLQTAKAKIETSREINIDIPKTWVPNGKVILDMNNITFSYHPYCNPIIQNFNLKIVGPERIALHGDNGSGKTTLVKLILHALNPLHGNIFVGIEQVSYLDQNVNLLNPKLSILANFKHYNPDVNETDAYLYLAQFLFRNVSALKNVAILSGGEKLRAGLACILMSGKPPQLLILDEPTNHLDLHSIASIESALKHYQGALLVISHDEKFLQNIGVQRTIAAPFIQKNGLTKDLS